MECRVSRRRALPWVVGLLLATSSSAFAQREPVDLKTLPPGQQVGSLRYCGGMYHEYDLGFKTDAGAKGPETTTPVLVPTGRVGDRAFVIFAGLDELKDALKKEC